MPAGFAKLLLMADEAPPAWGPWPPSARAASGQRTQPPSFISWPPPIERITPDRMQEHFGAVRRLSLLSKPTSATSVFPCAPATCHDTGHTDVVIKISLRGVNTASRACLTHPSHLERRIRARSAHLVFHKSAFPEVGSSWLCVRKRGR